MMLTGMMATPFPSYSPYTGYPALPLFSPSTDQLQQVSPMTPVVLVNQSRAWVRQSALQQPSQVTLMLPVHHLNQSQTLMMAELMGNGSSQTKALLGHLRSQGIMVRVRTSPRYLTLSVSGPSGQESQLIQTASRLLRWPMVDAQSFYAARDDVMKSNREASAMPELRLQEQLEKVFLGINHPQAYGTSDMLRDLPTVGFRQTLSQLQALTAAPHHAMWSMVSSLPVENQVAVLNQTLSQEQWTAPYPFPLPSSRSHRLPHPGTLPPVLIIADERAQRTQIRQIWRAPGLNDPDYEAFLVLKNIIESQSFGFFKVLRVKKGLVYSTKKEYNPNPSASTYQVGFEVDHEKTRAGLEGLNQTVDSFLNGSITQAQLQAARKKALLDLRQQTQSLHGVAQLDVQSLENHVMPKHPAELASRIQQIALGDLRRVARRVFDPNYGVGLLGIAAPQRVLQTLQPPVHER